MKLIATLATLAALVGQTEAVDSATLVRVDSIKIGNAPCTDEVVLTATPADAVATTAFYFSSEVLSSNTSATNEGLQRKADATCSIGGSAGADASAKLDVVALTESSGVYKWTWTPKTGCEASAALKVTLINVCNGGAYDYNGLAIKLKARFGTTKDEKASAQTTGVDTPLTTPTKLVSFEVTKMPDGKSETGEFAATFTGDTNLNGKKLVLSLPKGYSVPVGAKCSIKTATGDAFFVTGSAALTTKCDTPCVFTTAVPATGSTGAVDTSKLTFTCDKVTAGATVPAPATADVSIKAHTTTNQNLFVGYAKSKSDSPTKSPTAKAADSPASVATASGVVVGALGVAALFLA